MHRGRGGIIGCGPFSSLPLRKPVPRSRASCTPYASRWSFEPDLRLRVPDVCRLPEATRGGPLVVAPPPLHVAEEYLTGWLACAPRPRHRHAPRPFLAPTPSWAAAACVPGGLAAAGLASSSLPRRWSTPSLHILPLVQAGSRQASTPRRFSTCPSRPGPQGAARDGCRAGRSRPRSCPYALMGSSSVWPRCGSVPREVRPMSIPNCLLYLAALLRTSGRPSEAGERSGLRRRSE